MKGGTRTMYDMNFISRAHGEFDRAETVMQLCHMDYCFLQSGVFSKLSDNCKADYYSMMGCYYDRLVRKEGARA